MEINSDGFVITENAADPLEIGINGRNFLLRRKEEYLAKFIMKGKGMIFTFIDPNIIHLNSKT